MGGGRRFLLSAGRHQAAKNSIISGIFFDIWPLGVHWVGFILVIIEFGGVRIAHTAIYGVALKVNSSRVRCQHDVDAT